MEDAAIVLDGIVDSSNIGEFSVPGDPSILVRIR